MKYENVCPTCGTIRVMRQKTSRICMSCARELVWETRRLAALSDLVRRSRDVISVLAALLRHSSDSWRDQGIRRIEARDHTVPQGTCTMDLDHLERDIARLANDVMIAQLAIAEKGVAA